MQFSKNLCEKASRKKIESEKIRKLKVYFQVDFGFPMPPLECRHRMTKKHIENERFQLNYRGCTVLHKVY